MEKYDLKPLMIGGLIFFVIPYIAIEGYLYTTTGISHVARFTLQDCMDDLSTQIGQPVTHIYLKESRKEGDIYIVQISINTKYDIYEAYFYKNCQLVDLKKIEVEY